jgi:hypothetical protein
VKLLFLLLLLLLIATICGPVDGNEPLTVTQEEIGEHVKAQELVLKAKNDRIDELTKLLQDAQKHIEMLQGKTNCT